MNSKCRYKLIILVLLITLDGCKKLVEVNAPVTSLSSANVYTNDATAIAVLTGIYTTMSGSSLTSGNLTSMSVLAGLSSDELTLYKNVTGAEQFYYMNALSNSNVGNTDFWINIYPVIYISNSAIQGLSNNTDLTAAVQQQLMGEAKFIRALCYFYLVNLYGDVPLVTGTNYTVNELLPRTNKDQVWQQIINDLRDAQTLLNPNYLDATLLNATVPVQKVRPAKWVAGALLARTYLYTGDYADAIAETDSIINSGLYTLCPNLNNVFLANSSEAIWQLQPVVPNYNTLDGVLFIIPATGPNTYKNTVYLSDNLLTNFETGDERRMDWVDSTIVRGVTYYYPFKYKINSIGAPVTEYEMVFRLSEQYLIRAEAEAQVNDLSDAANDLNTIRNRAGLGNTTASAQPDLLNAIYHERQVEMFTEWGHRWLDLKRTGIIDTVMGMPENVYQKKGGTGSWNSDWELYPVSQSQLQTDPNLLQNAGY